MKNKKQAYSIFILILSTALFSNCRKEKMAPEQADRFIKYYGKSGNQKAGNVAATTDGGYVLVGTSDAYGDGKQILVVKTDAYGNEQWNKVLGGAGDDEGYNIQVAADGGFVIAGAKAEAAGSTKNAWVVKLNTDGTEMWAKEFGLAGKDESAARIINTPTDGGYITVGTTTDSPSKSSVYLLKINSAGDTLWSGKYENGTSNDLFNYGTAIQQIDDLNYLTSAYTTDAVGTTFSLDMLVTTGRLQNDKQYKSNSSIGKGTYPNIDIKDAQDIIRAGAGDKYILGTTTTGDVYILHTAADESFIAYKSFNTPDLDIVSGFAKTADGGFVIAGSATTDGNKDILVIRTDSNLSPTWTKKFGGTGEDSGSSVIQLPDGSFVVSATIAFGGNATGSNTVMALIHIDSNGELK